MYYRRERVVRGVRMEAFTNEFGLARNFGFDITMPEGMMGLPGAAHKDYMDTCSGLYREFINNMNTHIKYEKEMKKILRVLHQEKMRNFRFSLYRNENEAADNDPFSRRPVSVVSQSHTGLLSRNNTPWGLDVIPDDEEESGHQRPLTAPSLGQRSHFDDGGATNERPKTAGGALKRISEDEENNSDVTTMTVKTVLGIIDPKTEGTVSQKITVGQNSFTKLEHGELRAKLKNKDGKFLIKPVKSDYQQDDEEAIVAFDPSKPKKTYDPLNEKMALVRKITDFRSPTISSDMKINNRVPIQKSLRGIDAKRTSIVDIYRNARDRKSRHFRIVSAKTRYGTPGAPGSEENDLLGGNGPTTQAVRRSLTDFRTKIGVFTRLSMAGKRLREQNDHDVHVRDQVTPSPTPDDHHLSASMTGGRLKSILNIHGVHHDFTDNGRDSQIEMQRPSSKVAFVRSDSNASDHNANRMSLLTPDMARNRSESFTSNSSRKGAYASNSHGGRHRTVTENSETDDNVFHAGSRGNRTTEAMASVVTAAMLHKAMNGDQGHGQDVGKMAAAGAGGRRLSIVSAVSAASFVNKLKIATQKSKDSDKSELGFELPKKMESRTDTVKIVKQQMKQDKTLDERMTVWRRRMALKNSVSTSTMKSRKSAKLRMA